MVRIGKSSIGLFGYVHFLYMVMSWVCEVTCTVLIGAFNGSSNFTIAGILEAVGWMI